MTRSASTDTQPAGLRPSYRKFARAMGVASLAAALGVPLLQVLLWLGVGGMETGLELSISRQLGLDAGWLETPLRLGALAIVTPLTLVGAYGSWRLSKFFFAAADGAAFRPWSLGHFRAFATALLLVALVRPLQGAALTAYLTHLAPGERGYVQIAVGTPELAAIFTALSIFVVANLLAEAGRAEDELERIL
ncbi:MAG: hypothetical protein RKE49_14580 [Oceanicaulis sp.]